MTKAKMKLLTGSAILGTAGLAAAPLVAHHQWNTYAWSSDGVTPISPAVVDNTDARWTAHVDQAVADWNASPYINSALEYGNSSSCGMVTGTIQVCNDDYGATGWLGIASIALNNGTIVAGTTKLNDQYFERDYYNTFSWRQLVTCQEIGHDYGLGHQNEDFGTDLTTSCMEYTNQPSGNEGPDFHDYEELVSMYGFNDPNAPDSGGGGSDGGTDGGTDGGNGGKGGKGKGGGKGKNRVSLPSVGNTPTSWGRPTAVLPNGKPFRFEKTVGKFRYVTHVTWIPEEGGHDHGDHDH